MNETTVTLLVVLGFGGVLVYLMTRKSAPPPPPPPVQMCGASYAGVGASVPCDLVKQGIKELYSGAQYIIDKSGVGSEVKTAASGIKPWEVVVTPVAISHVAYNEIKRLNPFSW